MSGYAGHSLVVKLPQETAADGRCHAVYTSFGTLDPELYARPNGVVYLAGVNSSAIPLPKLATGAEPVEESVTILKNIAKRFIDSDEELEVVRTGLCFRPMTNQRVPILSRVSDGELGGVTTRPDAEGGVYVAAGHGPWGISLGLGTGRVMAEMMQGRDLSVDVGEFALDRF